MGTPKISGLRIDSSDRKDHRWLEALSHRNLLLSKTDWTQLPDSGLTDESVEEFRVWRQLLRDIKQKTAGSPDAVVNRVSLLKDKLPKPRRKDDFDYSINAEKDSQRESLLVADAKSKCAKDISLDIAADENITFPYGMDVIENAYREAERYLVNSKAVETNALPVLRFISESEELDIDDTIEMLPEIRHSRVIRKLACLTLKSKYMSLLHEATTVESISTLYREFKAELYPNGY